MTTARNANGQGSVYRRDSDGKWVATFYVDGRRRLVYGRTQGEATRKRRALLERVETGRPLTDSRMSFADYVATWTATTL